MVLHWSLSDSKYPQVSRTLLSILAVLNNVIVWMVSTHPPISKSSRPLNNPFVIVPKASITIGIIVTSMFHSFFSSLARYRYLSFYYYYYYYYCYYYSLRVFHTGVRGQRHSKYSQVSRTLHSILTDLNISVMWMVSSRSLISMSPNLRTNSFVTLPNAPITSDITVTFMFKGFSVLKQDLGTYMSFRFLLLLLCDQPERKNSQFSRFSFMTIIRSGRLARLGDPFLSPNCWAVCVSHFPGVILGCAYTICSYG